jgi:TonB-linked SusC/RagA family outer membrane protein
MVSRISRLWLAAAVAVGVTTVQPTSLAAQATGQITGVVTSAEGQPIEGASVNLVGTTRGILTNPQGRFTIAAVPAGSYQLRARFIGYGEGVQPVTVTAGATATVNFTLARQAVQLDAVVAVGYGTQKKVNLTGAVAAVEPAQLEKRPVANVSEALQGAAPGLTVIDRGGRPGDAGTTFFIRGRGTLNSTSPLVLVDGVPGDINAIDPNDIESVSVLKDAASAAIYGARAANGVILVSTKRGGNTGRIKTTYDGYYGIQSVQTFPSILGPEPYLRLINEAYVNGGRAPKYSEDYIRNTVRAQQGLLPADSALRYPWTNWLDVLWKPAPIQDHTVRLSGGNELAAFALSLNAMDQRGLVAQTGADRYLVRLNTDYHPTKRLSTGLDVTLRRTSDTEPNNMGGVLWNMFHDTPPTTMARYPDGTYGWSDNGNNPLAYAEAYGTRARKYTHGLLNAKADYTLATGLTLRTLASVQNGNWSYSDWRNQQNFVDYFNPSVVRKQITLNQLDARKSTDTDVYLRGMLEYTREFGRHGLTAMAGYDQTERNWEEIRAIRRDFYNNDLREINVGDAAQEDTWGTSNQWSLRSGFGRVNYNFGGKYLLEANARYDGSSKFASGNRFGFFPSFSAGWRISEEPFFKLGFVDELKLRGSWGRMGNQDAQGDLYPYWSTINLGHNYVFGDQLVTGAAKTELANRDISWETTEMTDLGLDATFLNGRLEFTGDVYRKNTSDILRRLPIPGIIGLTEPVQNKLKVRNVGWEATLGWRDRRGGFDYSANFNVAQNSNRVTDLAGSGPYIDGIWLTKEGYPLGTMFGYQAQGLFQSADEVKAHARQHPLTGVGDIRYEDQNADGKIDAADRVPIGVDMPKYTFGSSWTAGWKGLDLSVLFQGAWSVDYWVQGALVEGPFWENFTTTAWLDRWTPETPNGRMPKPTIRTSHNHDASDYWVYDASYAKLKNAQLGFTLPNALGRRVGSDRLRLYMAGQNLLTFTRSKDLILDPENPSGRANNYPQVRTVSFGVSASY